MMYYKLMAMADRQKIIIFSTAYFPFIGGAETAIKGITDKISDRDFYMITARFRRDLLRTERVGNIEVHRVGLGFKCDKWLLPVGGFFAARRLVRKISSEGGSVFGGKIKNYKIVLWGMMASWGSVAALLIKKWLPDLPFLLTLQEGDPEEYLLHGRFGVMGFFFKRIVRSADRIQTISEYLKGLALKVGAQAPIEVIPNGVDLKNFQPLRRDAEMAARLGISDADAVIATVSRLVKKNAVDVVIKALAELKKKEFQRRVKFLVLGVGPDEGQLNGLASELGVADQIIWGGLIKYDEVPKYLAFADVFVRPSRSEGLGSAFLEAMACGVPVIGTPVGGIPDFLRDGETGLFVVVDDSSDLAEKIYRLIVDQDLRRAIIEKSIELVRARYDWQEISGRISSIFDRLSGI